MRSLALADAWPAARVAVAACTAAGVAGRHGDTGHRFAWASVSKPVSALAVLVACEEGAVGLDDTVGPPGSTLAHLLAHASGLSPDDPSVTLAHPAARRIYSNAGIELAAAHVEAATGIRFADYLDEAVLTPLGMTTARLAGSPAHGMEGGLDDLCAVVGECFAPRLVHPDTFARATTVAFPGLAGVLPGFGRQDPCDFGLGFEVKGAKQPHWTGTACSPTTFGHFGQSGSFFWVDPAAGVAAAGLADRPFGPWAAVAWPELADAVLAELATGGDPPPAAL